MTATHTSLTYPKPATLVSQVHKKSTIQYEFGVESSSRVMSGLVSFALPPSFQGWDPSDSTSDVLSCFLFLRKHSQTLILFTFLFRKSLCNMATPQRGLMADHKP